MVSLILSVFMLFSLTSTATERRCMIPGSPAVELGRANAVFTGKVVGREYVKDVFSEPDVTGERLVIKIAVERVWKGEVGKEVLMYTSTVRHSNDLISMMAEDFNFTDDKRYLIYAVGAADRLQTSACSRSRMIEKAEADLRELGKGYEPLERKNEKINP
jgi:hypothetical protein